MLDDYEQIMRTIYQNSYEKTHIDVFESKISEITFKAFNQENLDEWTTNILNMFQTIELEMGDLCIKESPTHPAPPSRIFRVKNPEGLFWYIDIIPITKQYVFIADEKHTQAISKDTLRQHHQKTEINPRFSWIWDK